MIFFALDREMPPCRSCHIHPLDVHSAQRYCSSIPTVHTRQQTQVTTAMTTMMTYGRRYHRWSCLAAPAASLGKLDSVRWLASSKVQETNSLEHAHTLSIVLQAARSASFHGTSVQGM